MEAEDAATDLDSNESKATENGLKSLEDVLNKQKFLTGNSPTQADIVIFHRLRKFYKLNWKFKGTCLWYHRVLEMTKAERMNVPQTR